MADNPFDVFLSFAHNDSSLAGALADALEKKGLRVWYDKRRLRLGDSFLHTIEDALEQSRCFLLLISPDYFRGQ